MSFNANVLRVAIASPSDVQDARNTVEKVLHDWNAANSAAKKVVLLPWRWETSSVPLLGSHPQDIINMQGIDSADIVIALFGSRLGAPTPDAVSGTVEEIKRALQSEKPVHLYFSTADIPYNVDTSQVEGLREFKTAIQQRGLYKEFRTIEQLQHEIWKAVEYDVISLDLEPEERVTTHRGVVWKVQSRDEQEAKGFDNKGRMKYRTKHWYEITNVGDIEAVNTTFSMSKDTKGVLLSSSDKPVSIRPDTTWKINAVYMWGLTQPRLMISWDENGERKEQIFDVQ